MEDPTVDVTRQAELVVMDCLKNWNCPRSLDALMRKVTAGASVVASERFSRDMDMKKKTTEERISLLEYMISATSETTDTPTLSSRQRSRPGTPTAKETGAEPIEWSKEEITALKKAIKKTSAVEDKNQRWKDIANLVGNGKTKKHCYVKYKDLKEEQTKAAARKASPRRQCSVDEKSSELDKDKRIVIKKGVNLAVATDTDMILSPMDVSASSSAFASPRRTAALEVTSAQPSLDMLEVEDCEDVGELLKQPAPGGSRINRASNDTSEKVSSTAKLPSASDIAAVQQLLFGASKKTFSSHWEEQGFAFSTVRDLQYGLVQHQGGPCGILAVVQGYVLRFLLQSMPVDWKNPGVPHQERALAQALTHILWQAARASRGAGNTRTECVIAVRDNTNGQRRFMSGYKLLVASTEEQTKQMLTANLPQFMESMGSGLVQFVVSVLLTKGVDVIKGEMDQGMGGQLIGAHDYCTQDIVNLLLCGYACSNVFNGKQVLEGGSSEDTIVLRGVSSQSVVGFLSLFEAYQNLVVGSYLKQPRFNIWVVCSESHYSVLFVADRDALEDQALADRRTVDLLYYDGLANQDEEIRLSVDTLALPDQSATASHKDLVPPLNLVIRTKWPRASVDWNGVEPHL
ncbi:hypothetical protein PHYBOEH_002890 [Phytophthora boehmeriae]|uniref:Myb-like domain-containing protein n=1 Tax=Phytophthora boehmeriae TaxID=109152 RepID=A0A8T1WUT1_9STRA|nr:hypothetical protein PHYBOEH_002890 [Phytophthora boehmeriae]